MMRENISEEVFLEIQKRAEGVMYLSETDNPIYVHSCQLEEPKRNYMLKISGRNDDEEVEETSLSYLYKNFNTLLDRVNFQKTLKYQNLINYVTDNLENIKVFKIGEQLVDIFIIGSVHNGKYITLSTKSEES